MQLAALRAARMWVNSQSGLPTPLQYGMALKSASMPGIFSALSYLRYLSSAHAKIPRFVMYLAAAMIAQTVIGFLGAAADVWMHISSTTVPWVTVTPQLIPDSAYSRDLNSTCLNTPTTINTFGCGIKTGQTDSFAGLEGISEGLKTVNAVSSFNAVQTDNATAFLTPANSSNSTDFRAHTYGIKSQCLPISSVCNLSTMGGIPPNYVPIWDCDQTFTGLNLRKPQTYNSTTSEFPNINITTLKTPQNPAPVALTIVVDTVDAHDDEFVPFSRTTSSSTAIMLWCELNVLDVTYEMSAGKASILSVNQTSAMITWSLLSYLNAADLWQVQSVTQPLWLAAEMDAISGNSTQFADSFAEDFSRIMIGLAAGIMTNASTLEETSRTMSLVSRLPKAPLYLFIISSFLLTVLSVVLVLLSIQFGSSEIRSLVMAVQARLTDPVALIQETYGNDTIMDGKESLDDASVSLQVRRRGVNMVRDGKLLELCESTPLEAEEVEEEDRSADIQSKEETEESEGERIETASEDESDRPKIIV